MEALVVTANQAFPRREQWIGEKVVAMDTTWAATFFGLILTFVYSLLHEVKAAQNVKGECMRAYASGVNGIEKDFANAYLVLRGIQISSLCYQPQSCFVTDRPSCGNATLQSAPAVSNHVARSNPIVLPWVGLNPSLP